MTITSQKLRRSPSGPLADVQLPVLGSNVLTTSSTHYLLVGGLGDSATEVNGQVAIAEPGVLRKFIAQNVKPGGTAKFVITYNIRLNGVLIPGATVVTDNEAVDPVEIDLNQPVVGPDVGQAADLVSVEVVVAAFGGGTTPVVRTFLLWTPGAQV